MLCSECLNGYKVQMWSTCCVVVVLEGVFIWIFVSQISPLQYCQGPRCKGMRNMIFWQGLVIFWYSHSLFFCNLGAVINVVCLFVVNVWPACRVYPEAATHCSMVPVFAIWAYWSICRTSTSYSIGKMTSVTGLFCCYSVQVDGHLIDDSFEFNLSPAFVI